MQQPENLRLQRLARYRELQRQFEKARRQAIARQRLLALYRQSAFAWVAL